MKANQKFLDRAEVGVGTLIIFIAMVLVAAVAAAVLINTTGVLQQRAQSTGQEATQEVSSNLKVLNVYGTVDSTDNYIDELRINTELSAGALPIDLTKLVVRLSDGAHTYNYQFVEAYDASGSNDGSGACTPGSGNRVDVTKTTNNGGPVEQGFILHWIRPQVNEAGSTTYGCPDDSVMKPGDLVELDFAVKPNAVLANSHAFAPRTPVEVTIIPEQGSPVAADFKTPATYGDATTITLR